MGALRKSVDDITTEIDSLYAKGVLTSFEKQKAIKRIDSFISKHISNGDYKVEKEFQLLYEGEQIMFQVGDIVSVVGKGKGFIDLAPFDSDYQYSVSIKSVLNLNI